MYVCVWWGGRGRDVHRIQISEEPGTMEGAWQSLACLPSAELSLPSSEMDGPELELWHNRLYTPEALGGLLIVGVMSDHSQTF